jgi:hypothetical protein
MGKRQTNAFLAAKRSRRVLGGTSKKQSKSTVRPAIVTVESLPSGVVECRDNCYLHLVLLAESDLSSFVVGFGRVRLLRFSP